MNWIELWCLSSLMEEWECMVIHLSHRFTSSRRNGQRAPKSVMDHLTSHGGSVGKLKSSHDLNTFWWIKFAQVRAVLSEAIKPYPEDDEANSKEVDSIDCSNLRPFRNGKPPVHEPTWSVPPTKTLRLIFLSRMFPFCPKKPTWTGSMPVIQACFVARFFSCQFLQTPFHFEEFFIFPFRGKVPCCQKSNCWRTFRSLPYGYICTSLRYWIQHDSSWKCWATHSTFICFYAR